MNADIVCEIRCPIHGFIGLNEWERDLVDSPVFQRLRRIRQLAWTDLVYPSAMHTRFEHSLGVMHVATLLFDSIVRNSKKVLYEYGFDDHWLSAERQKVRLAALLHDIGHSPFSHASETVFPLRGTTAGNRELPFKNIDATRYSHEDYTYALIKNELRELIEEHRANRSCNFRAEDITALLKGEPDARHSLIWRDLLANQLDADRMDYLLRDSHHLGVNYGKYDLHRLVASVCAFESIGLNDGSKRVQLGVQYGGLHAAESLLIARYSMFKQVYFHKTRMAYDIHLQKVMSQLLPDGCFPLPDETGLKEYLKWDDWKVLGLLADGDGGVHADRMLKRDHYRQVYRSKDRTRTLDEMVREQRKTERVWNCLSEAGVETERKTSKNSWYKVDDGAGITIVSESDSRELTPLVEYSAIASLNTGSQYFLYVKKDDVEKAASIINDVKLEFDKEPMPAPPEARAAASQVPVRKPISSDSQLVNQSASIPSKDVSGSAVNQ